MNIMAIYHCYFIFIDSNKMNIMAIYHVYFILNQSTVNNKNKINKTQFN